MSQERKCKFYDAIENPRLFELSCLSRCHNIEFFMEGSALITINIYMNSRAKSIRIFLTLKRAYSVTDLVA